MNDLLTGLLGLWLATNQPAALSNLVRAQTGLEITVPDPDNPVEREYRKLLEQDDAAQEEVDGWIRKSQEDPLAESPLQKALLQGRIEQRLEKVRQAYETFLTKHPEHVPARLAYGSFLSDIQEEESAKSQWEKARQLNPDHPAAWNNLANYYGHNGPVEKAFEYYAKAITLRPSEPVYYQNLATTIYLFRRDATNYYQLTLPQVYERVMELYQKAMTLDPDNFILATEVAQTYYGMPLPTTGDPTADQRAVRAQAEQALAAWNRALKLARDDVERQGVLLHLARIQINLGDYDQARQHLQSVTNTLYNATRGNLIKKLEDRQAGPASEP